MKAIMAINNDLGYGFEGDLPWKDIMDDDTKADMKRFKTLTSGQAVFMGYKTMESLEKIGMFPLPNRVNIVISRSMKKLLVVINKYSVVRGMFIGDDPEESINEYLQSFKNDPANKEMWYIGGAGRLLDLFMPHIDTFHLTVFEYDVKSDVFMKPEIYDRLMFGGEFAINADRTIAPTYIVFEREGQHNASE